MMSRLIPRGPWSVVGCLIVLILKLWVILVLPLKRGLTVGSMDGNYLINLDLLIRLRLVSLC